MAKKKTMGGKREGAGRPVSPDGKAVVVAASIPGPLVEGLDRVAAAEGWSRSKAVTEAVRMLVKRKDRA